MFLRLLLTLLLLFAGCSRLRPPTTQPTTQPSDVLTVKVRPIIISNNDKTPWSDQTLQYKLEFVNQAYLKAKVQFDFLPKEQIENPVLYEIASGEEFAQLSIISKEKAENNNELAVFFVHRILIGDNALGGLANYPSNANGTIYQHGIAISLYSSPDVVCHELGHAYNLYHTWVDTLTDTPSLGQLDCELPATYCNIMSYCSSRSVLNVECRGMELSEQQIKMVRKWAIIYPRSLVLEQTVMPIMAEHLPYTSSTQPVE